MKAPLLPYALSFVLAVAGCSGSSKVKGGGPFVGDAANASYDFDGTVVKLKAGTFQDKTGDTDLTTALLDVDLDGDDVTDRAVVLTRDDGPLKSHYLAVLLGGSSKATCLSLGKNILVQRLAIDPQGGVLVTMLTHEKGVPIDSPPTIEVTKRFTFANGKLAAREH